MDKTQVALGIVREAHSLSPEEFQNRYPPKTDRMYDPNDPFYMTSTDYLNQYNPNRLHCADGGACHHACASNEAGACFRRDTCGPLSNSGWEMKDGKWVQE
jgi:hypothetical protein